MVDFRQGYVPPGVYVSADTSAVASAVGATPTVVCLVGPSLGYRSGSDVIVFNNTTDSTTLSAQGINQNSVLVTSTVAGNTTSYSVTTDYTLTPSDQSAPDSVTTISIVGSGNIVPGAQLTVTYTYADDDFYSLHQFSDYASFVNIYGAPFNPSGSNLQSPLSLAAQIAFDNGASEIYAVTLNGLGQPYEQYAAAYALTQNNYDINLLVPILPSGTGTNFPVDLSSLTPYVSGITGHLKAADSDGFPRNAIVGIPDTFDSTVSPDQIATQFNYRRVVLVWPNQLTYSNSLATSSGTNVIGGGYLAAACAGILANNPTAQGLTKRQVFSISNIAPALQPLQTTSNKNLWSSRGVAVLEANRLGQLTIRHGVTTDTSSVVSREFSIVRCQDELFTEIQQSLEQSQLIGTPITEDTPLSVKSIIAGALEAALSANTIYSYDNLAVRQQSLPTGDPTVIEAVFTYRPTYPLNYITVSFAFDLSTGDITSTSDTAAA